MSEPLPGLVRGGGADRVVLLHGFGGSSRSWSAVLEHLDAPVLAPDLPGHGAALDRDDVSTVEARDAILAELDRHGIERAHLVGHSRGGVVAFLVAAKVPERVASLTLLAPGGCGEAIAADALAAFAAAGTRDEIASALAALYAPARPSRRVIDEEVAHRRDARVVPVLKTIRAAMTPDGRQGLLKLSLLADAPFPITVLWGERDAVLPVAQAGTVRDAIPRATIRILPDRGHMLPAEMPAAMADAIGTQFRANRALPLG